MTTLLPRNAQDLPPTTHEIDVVVSDRAEDVDAVLAVVHDGFVESGFMAPQASGRRFHPAYLNPGTIFALVRVDGEPIGAATMTSDGPFGLPCDRAFAEEVDTLREATPNMIRECGSFCVLPPWRRHTRRAFVRILAAFTRIALDEFPDAPGLVTVAPEAERFYDSLGGFSRIAGPRPLFGAPAVLVHSPNAVALNERHRTGASQGQRTISRLTLEPTQDWLIDRRSHRPLPARMLGPLVDEQLAGTPFGAQLRLLRELHPEILDSLVGAASNALPG